MYFFTKNLDSKGRKIRKNISEISRDTGLTRFNVKRGICGLVEKKYIRDAGSQIDLFTSMMPKEDKVGTQVEPPFLYLQILANYKEIEPEWGNNLSHFLNNSVYNDMFDEYYAALKQEIESQGLRVSPPGTNPTPYYIDIYRREIFDQNSASQTSPDERSKFHNSSDLSKNEKPENQPLEKLPPVEGAMTAADIDALLESDEIGSFTHTVLQAFLEMGDQITADRISDIREWLNELVDIYGINADMLDWCEKVIFGWKQFHRNKKIANFESSLSTFFQNAKKPV